MRRILAVTAAVGVLATACTDGTPDPDGSPTALFTEAPTAAPSAPDGTAAPSPTDATEIDVTTTPDPVTEEWAEAVINTLLAEYGEVLAEALSLPVVDDVERLPEDLPTRLESVFEGEFLSGALAGLDEIARDVDLVRAEVFPADQYQGLRMQVVELQVVESGCIVLVGRLDTSGLSPQGELVEALSAWSLTPAATSSPSNPTDWALLDQLTNTGPGGELNPDETMLNSTLETYGTALQHTCGDTQ